MTDYRVPRGCTGLQMQDGTRYQARRDGRVVVDREDHARHIERVSGNGGGQIHKSAVTGPVGTPAKHCTPCRFTAYAWSTACPRCGGELTTEALPPVDVALTYP